MKAIKWHASFNIIRWLSIGIPKYGELYVGRKKEPNIGRSYYFWIQ